MTNQERLDKIEEIQAQINPINYQKLFLETKRHFAKGNFFKNYSEEKKQEIINIEKELEGIYSKLNPLFAELRQLQNKYRVQYKGELTNSDRSTYWQTQVEEFYFKINCDIDTVQNSWEPYINDDSVSDLILEIHEFLYLHRYSKLAILNIKKIGN